nr:MAG TPA: hypothetical protein [Caudoviricetes sp.]
MGSVRTTSPEFRSLRGCPFLGIPTCGHGDQKRAS